MNPYALPDLIALGANSIFGIYVYVKSRKGITRYIFTLLMISICIWQFSEFNLVSTTNPRWALFWDRFVYVGMILAPNASFVLALVFPRRNPFITNTFRLLLLFSPSVVLFALLPTDLFISGVQMEYWGYGKIKGPLYWLFGVHMLVFVGLTLGTLYDSYRKAETGRERTQCKYLMGGFSFPGIMGILILLVLQPLGVKHLNMAICSIASIFMISILSYSIVRHRLMDTDIIIRKSSAYLMSLVSIIVPSIVITLLLQNAVFGYIDYVFSLAFVLILSLSSVFFSLVKPRAERTVEQKIFRERFAYKSVLTDLSKEIVTIIDLNSLCRKIVDTISTTMGIERALIFLFDDEKKNYVCHEAKTDSVFVDLPSHSSTLSFDDPVILWLQRQKNILIREEWTKRKKTPELRDATDQMRKLDVEVCVPLMSKGRLIGVLVLGRKTDNKMYSHEDVDVLEAIANGTAIAVENAKLYEDLKKQKAVMRRADRLASLGTLTAGLAHEIRNPLVAIKTLIQLLPERIDDEEFRRDFLAVASGEVDRISSLVNELLEFARPAEPHLQHENIHEIMDGMILLVSTEVKKRNIAILTRYEENLPPVPVDREQIKQVFLNLLLNAIEASDEEGQVRVEIRTFQKGKDHRVLQTEISDTGCGIREDHLEQIFTPFFTTKDKGSGLGLSISHQIIQEHGGTIAVESRLGEGSSFFLNLPIPPVDAKTEGWQESDGLEETHLFPRI